MKCYISAVCALSVLVALSNAAPMPQSDQGNALDQREQTTRIVNGINSKIMMLRQYCPQLFQVIDNVIQNVTSTAFRVIGRVLLQSGGLGGGGDNSGGGGGGESRVSVVLPTFGPDEDYDDEDEDEDNSVVASSSTSTTEASRSTSTSTSSTTTSSSTSTTTDDGLDIRVNDIRVPENTDKTLFTSPASDSSRTKREVRTIRAAEEEDQEAAASGGNGPSPSDDLSNVDADDADRDKRYSPFGGGFGVQAHAGGGGSGNFLFDIIRLIAGSGATEESDEKDNAPGAGGVAEIDLAKTADGYTEGIPGPITRLFVLANRGLANLVQDLILRLAQTSERIVNFKARLITALI